MQSGDNVLITGIGGGVALLALQICVAFGANVYVTSGSEDKIRKAVALGAKGGVNYKDGLSCTREEYPCRIRSNPESIGLAKWQNKLHDLMKQEAAKAPVKTDGPVLLSAVIDSAGGDLVSRVNRILRSGGRIVVYGM